MMKRALDETDQRLLDEWQRDFPLCSYPFAHVGEALGIGENEVLSRMKDLIGRGMVSRIGGTIVPNIVSASTLAAVAVPDARIEEVAAQVSRMSGINHSYLRENHWNLWFVATGPDRAHGRPRGAGGARSRARSRPRSCPYPAARGRSRHPAGAFFGARARGAAV